jgi:choline dehydrogenase-like flavoprotein
MPVVTAQTANKAYDVIVVGSGAAGGQSAYTLTMEGAKVLMIEAGRIYDPLTETAMFQTPDMAPLRDAATTDKQHDFFDATINGGHTIPGEPYTNASADPQLQMRWWRARMLGGRTNHWGRNAFRFGPYDFKARSHDGMGVDWPIGYEDMAPWYDKVERLIGVYGQNDGIENSPHSPDGILLPPPKLRAGEMLAQQRAGKLGIPVIHIHRAVLTRPLDWRNLPAKIHPGNAFAQRILAADMQKRAACFWATACSRGCSIRANYQATTVHIPPAMDTGNLDILPNAMAREVTLNAQGRATGVAYIDKTTGREEHVSARAVVLAAGAMESVRILLNSKSNLFPNGLANSSGRLGLAIMDNGGTGVRGHIPLLENMIPHNEDGAGGPHAYIPWWGYKDQREGKLDFTRGYYVSFQSGRAMPTMGTAARIEGTTGGSYGRKFKEDARRYYGAFLGFTGQGQKIPDDRAFCELDPEVKDKWGIPVLRFHWYWSENEYRMAAHMQKTFASIIEAMGGKVLSMGRGQGRNGADIPNAANDFAAAGSSGRRASIDRRPVGGPGGPVHECGGAAMGDDPAKSVTNAWGRTWDVKNLYLADAATVPSNSSKNITQTIMALAWRACDNLFSEMKKGTL